MPITDVLTRNATEFPDDVALVEVIPTEDDAKNRVTWKDYSLIERGTEDSLRSEMTWKEFDQKANRFANFLLSRGVKKGDKVATGIVDYYIEHLACGIASIINIFQPEIICIGGGICNERGYLLDPLNELVAREQYTRENPKKSKIVVAELGNDAGIIGAACLGL